MQVWFPSWIGWRFICRFSWFLTLFGSLLGSILGQKGEKVEYGKTSEKVVEKFQAGARGNSGSGPCGPLKEFKKSANSPGLRPKGGHLKQYRGKLPGIRIRNTPLVPCRHGGGLYHYVITLLYYYIIILLYRYILVLLY